MLRRTAGRCGVFAMLKEELAKLPAYLAHRGGETVEFLKGEDPQADPAAAEKKKKHREMYEAILAAKQQQAAAAVAAAKAQQRAKDLQEKASVWQRARRALAEGLEALQHVTSQKAGVMALLQHCTASHAAEVALEQGIDVKNVSMVLEKAPASAPGIGAGAAATQQTEEVVVGYIDAPNATDEEVRVFAQRLHKACPVANTMKIDWRRKMYDTEETGPRPRHGDGGGASAEDPTRLSAEQIKTSEEPFVVPPGTPGYQRMRGGSAQNREGLSGQARPDYMGSRSGSRLGRDDGDELHLPGFEQNKKKDREQGDDKGDK